ncbi:MAG: GIY-YIG nuclease family protein [Candidatus Omnitrophica bacterium]|nr:GIY-YIG nuclease family protein [Candidatus Omnitrophota bacterium]
MKRTVKRSGTVFYTYIVECRDGTYYTGYTSNLERRIKAHNGKGPGAKYTRGRGPVRVVWSKKYKYLAYAMKLEHRIKQLKRKQKEKMIKTYETERP